MATESNPQAAGAVAADLLHVEGHSVSLEALYQPPRAVLLSDQGAGQVVDLESDCQAWLEHPDAKNVCRWLVGDSGLGRTSFAQMFALRHQGIRQVIVVDMAALAYTAKGIVEALTTYLDATGWTGTNPLVEGDESTCLLVLDGLEALKARKAAFMDKVTGNSSMIAAEKLVADLVQLLPTLNQQGVRLHVLMTASEAYADELWQPGSGARWQLLPYQLEAEQGADWEDEGKLLEKDPRQGWWKALATAARLDGAVLSELDKDAWKRSLVTPLDCLALARRVVVTGTLGKPGRAGCWQAWVESGIGSDAPDGQQLVLEQLATLAWKRGDLRMDEDMLLLESLVHRVDQAGVRAASPLFTPDEKGDLVFTQTAVRNHLAIVAMLRAIKRMMGEMARRTEHRDSGWGPEEALLCWQQNAGRQWFDSGMLRQLQGVFSELGKERVGAIQSCLEELFSHTLRQGMPTDKLFPRLSFADEMRTAESATHNLFLTLQAAARVAERVTQIEWPSTHWADNFLSMRYPDGGRLIRQSLAWLCLANQQLERVDLRHVDLRHADLTEAQIRHCDLRDVDLRQANLEGSRWEKVAFARVDLRGALLAGTSLVDVDCSDVAMRGADLRHVTMVRVDLTGKDLDYAELYGARLEGIDLAGATLRGAKLQRANLKGADLSGAQLQNADLTDADLTGARLADANLKGARLTDAKLEGANTQGAYLRKADLRGTVLDRH